MSANLQDIAFVEEAAVTEQAWTHICAIDDIVPNTGVCALVGDHQVAVFRVEVPPADAASGKTNAAVASGSLVFAIANYDPNSNAAVLSRGIVGNLGERIVVASPIYKQHFDLRSGECLEAPECSVSSFAVDVRDGVIWVSSNPTGAIG